MSGYRLVRLSPGEGPDVWPLPEVGDAIVGRRGPAGDAPAVDLAPDLTVSRRHARIRLDPSGCWIEDLQSKSGTWVGRRRLPPGDPQRCEAGTEIRIGGHHYTVFPPSWFRLRHGNLVFELSFTSPFGAALDAAGSPIVPRLAVRNWGDSATSPARLSLSIGDLARVGLAIPRLAASESHAVVPGVEIDRRALHALAAHRQGAVRAHLDGVRIDHGEIRLTLLAGDEWSYRAEHRLSLAAFVLPSDPAVVQVSREASRGLSLKAGGRAVLERVYEHLANEWSVDYRKDRPPAPSGSQKLRLPGDVLWDRDRRAGEGTCIDLALLLAGCLESLRLPALLAIVDLGRSWHALAGVWLGGRRRVDPLPTDRAALLDGAAWIDPNGCTRDRAQRAELGEAAERARNLLSERPLVFALDVAAARGAGCQPLPPRSQRPAATPSRWRGRALRR